VGKQAARPASRLVLKMKKIMWLTGGFFLGVMATIVALKVIEQFHNDRRAGGAAEPVARSPVAEHDYAFYRLSPILDGGSFAYVFKSKIKTMTILEKHGFGTKESSPHRYYHIAGEDLNAGAEIIANSIEEGEIIERLGQIKLRDKAVAHDVDQLIECLRNRQVCPHSFKWEEFSKRSAETRSHAE